MSLGCWPAGASEGSGRRPRGDPNTRVVPGGICDSSVIRFLPSSRLPARAAFAQLAGSSTLLWMTRRPLAGPCGRRAGCRSLRHPALFAEHHHILPLGRGTGEFFLSGVRQSLYHRRLVFRHATCLQIASLCGKQRLRRTAAYETHSPRHNFTNRRITIRPSRSCHGSRLSSLQPTGPCRCAESWLTTSMHTLPVRISCHS